MTVEDTCWNVTDQLDRYQIILRLVAQRVFTCVVVALVLCVDSLTFARDLLRVIRVKDPKPPVNLLHSLCL